jgi:hypothetical protein
MKVIVRQEFWMPSSEIAVAAFSGAFLIDLGLKLIFGT